MTQKRRPKKNTGPPSLENRKARFRFEILETIEVGVVLVGTEVKSLRKGQANLTEAYAIVRGTEAFLLNLHIQPYLNAGAFNHAETRTRKLLLKKAQIYRLKNYVEAKRFTLVPLKLYFSAKGRVKILLGLGRGKKVADKRETEKKAQAQKDMDRAMRELRRY